MGMHGLSTMHTDLLTDVQALREAGYDSDTWASDPWEALPGNGAVPLKEGIEAARAAGYDDVWMAELYSLFHSQWSPTMAAHEVKRRMDALLAA